MSYERYLDAERQLNRGLIRLEDSLLREGAPPRDPVLKLAKMRAFLDTCGHPERGIPAVHVAGTSGKGSVATGIAGILAEAGLKVGLHVSPYLQSATEKISVAGRFISSDDFADLVEWVMPMARPLVRPETPASIHGMASVAIALEAFRRAAVDIIVFEAGCGGRFDLSAFVETEVAVVTNVGLDHLVSLGPGLEQIAWHKAGVARTGKPLVTGAAGKPLDIIRAEVAAVGAPLFVIPNEEGILAQNRKLGEAAAALAAGAFGRRLSSEDMARGYGAIKLPGRSEQMPGPAPRVIFDGAHNPDKLACAVDLALVAPTPGPRVCLFGALSGKAGDALVRPLIGRFDRIITTEPQVYAKSSCAAEAMAAFFRAQGENPVAVPVASRALDLALAEAGPDGSVLVTGSFYLIGALRDRWYAKRAVVVERTSFPTGRG